MDAKYIEFYSSMMNKINSSGECVSKNNFLREVCAFFDFGNGFIFQKDETSIFKKTEEYSLYTDNCFPS